MNNSHSVKVVEMTIKRRIVLAEKVCPRCGERFLGKKIQKYCSKRCSNLAAYWRNPDTYRQKRLESYERQKGTKVKQKKLS